MIITEESSFSDLIDSTGDDFRVFCGNKDLGYLSSLHNFLVQTYEQVRSVKDELVRKMAAKEIPTTDESKYTLNGLYSKLLKIEEKVFIVREIRDNLVKSLPGSLTAL